MALLHLCLETSRDLGVEVIAAHFDHALREESVADAEFVARSCKDLGVKLLLERGDVETYARQQGIGLEEAGRAQRYAFFERSAAALDCRWVVLGHHRQDQAETVLHRLVRGTGLTGIAAMRVRRGIFIRPLLFCSREELRDHLAFLGGEYRDDPSNSDTRFTRNYIRHQVLPRLRQLNPKIEEALSNLAEGAAVEEEYWACRIEELRERLRHPRGGWSIPELSGLHPAERSRVLLSLLRGTANGQIGYVHLAAVESMLRATAPQAEVNFPGGVALRRFERLEFTAKESDPPKSWELVVTGEGSFELPDGALLTLSREYGGGEESRWSMVFPLKEVRFPLLVRPFRPGDRIAMGGDGGHKKLKKLYAELRVEREARMQLPLLVMGGEVLWIPGLRRSGEYRFAPGRGEGLRITLEKPESIESLLVKSGCLC